ncbi:G5 domain-containing protein [Christensenellaceae bacterium OttesenSCG-928-K19]|nr:G5 domain-containing protein [Christensenellaceae bacterium OttesenSCG-928-K19]
MPGKRMDDRDLELHPETKYKGILYGIRQGGASDEDIDLPRPSRPRKEKPAGSIRFGRKSASGQPRAKVTVDEAEGRVRRTSYTKPSGKGLSGNLRKLVAANSKKGKKKRKFNDYQGVVADRVIKMTMVACAAIVVISAIAIPTGFAKPTTDITLNDGGRVMEAPTSATTVGEFLADNMVEIGEEDVLETDPEAPITEGMEIVIRRAMPVTIHTAEGTQTIPMVAGTVEDALRSAEIEVAEADEVYPSLDTYVRDGMTIEHITVEVGHKTEVEKIPFETEQQNDSTILEGEVEIARYGEEGELEIVSEQIYKNGLLTSDKVIEENVIKEPVSQLELVGTWVPIRTPNGDICKFVMTMRTTAYCAACNTGNKTAVGTYPRYTDSFGTIAAKDSKLPYGTWVYIPGYGYGKVEDTGGFPQGTIDLYIGDYDTCVCGEKWGVRYKDVYVLY